jgi:hypothetical protein
MNDSMSEILERATRAINEQNQTNDPKPTPNPSSSMEVASRQLRGFASEHIRPTIEALDLLEKTIHSYRKQLQNELQLLEDASEAFALHNMEANECLHTCLDAVNQVAKRVQRIKNAKPD